MDFSQPGDIALVRERDLLSTAIVWGQRVLRPRMKVCVAHAMLCITPGGWLHANPGLGVCLDAEDELFPSRPHFRELRIFRPPGEKEDLDRILSRFEQWTNTAHFFLEQKYNWALGLSEILSGEAAFCSELVAKAYKDSGHHQFADLRTHKLYPCDLHDHVTRCGWVDISDRFWSGIAWQRAQPDYQQELAKAKGALGTLRGVFSQADQTFQFYLDALLTKAKIRKYQYDCARATNRGPAVEKIYIGDIGCIRTQALTFVQRSHGSWRLWREYRKFERKLDRLVGRTGR